MVAVTLELSKVVKRAKTELALSALEIFKREAVTLVKTTACSAKQQHKWHMTPDSILRAFYGERITALVFIFILVLRIRRLQSIWLRAK